jgi:hypothetical protein
MYDAWNSSWGDYHYGTGMGSYVCNPGSGFACGGVRLVFDQQLVEASSYGDLNSYPNGFVLWDSQLKNFQHASLTSLSDDGLTLQVNSAAARCLFYLRGLKISLPFCCRSSDHCCYGASRF